MSEDKSIVLENNFRVTLDRGILNNLADFICGDSINTAPVRRLGVHLHEFFAGIGFEPPQFHNESVRRLSEVFSFLNDCDDTALGRIILSLASPKLYQYKSNELELALKTLNIILAPVGVKIRLVGVTPSLIPVAPHLADLRLDEYSMEPEKSVEPRPFEEPPPDFLAIGMDKESAEPLILRFRESVRCRSADAYLASIIMMGSLLEGLLLWLLSNHVEQQTLNNMAPTDRNNTAKQLRSWSLGEMLDAASRLGWVGKDISGFAQSLREFRNLVHVSQQQRLRIVPTKEICEICWNVTLAALKILTDRFAKD